jgi:hypothetical protein
VLVLVLVLVLPVLLIEQGPVVATLGAFYGSDHALVQGRGLLKSKGAATVATLYGARTTITRSCRATRSYRGWPWLPSLA